MVEAPIDPPVGAPLGTAPSLPPNLAPVKDILINMRGLYDYYVSVPIQIKLDANRKKPIEVIKECLDWL